MAKYICDLCSEPGKRRKMTFYPAATFQQAVRAGLLRPHRSPRLGIAQAMSNMAWAASDIAWAETALADNTERGLCSSCVSRVDGYLKT